MGSRYASGQELLNFFINHGYIVVEEIPGSKAIACLPENKDTLIGGIGINYTHKEIPDNFLEDTLGRGGFTVEEFWREAGH